MDKFKTFGFVALVICFSFVFSPSVFADAIGLTASVTQWSPSWDGNLGNGDLEGDMSLDDDKSTGFSIAFEHPVPVFPNIKFQSTPLSTKGTSTSSFSMGTVNVISSDDIDLAFDSYDAIFYWQALDNWVSLDLGLAARQYDGELLVNGVSEVDGSIVLPMLYTGARFDLPLSGFYGRGELLFVSYGGSSIHDFQFGLGYESSLHLGAELGLRSSSISLDDVEDFDTDISASGAYFSLSFSI